MKCLSCSYYEATHGSQCESCALGDTGRPDPQQAQYDDFVNASIEAQRLAQADEAMSAVIAALDEYDASDHPADPQVLFACVSAVAKAVGR